MPEVAVQQFMIASACTTPSETARVLGAVRAAGYDSIELCGFLTQKTSFAVRALTRLAGMPTGRGGDYDWQALLREADLSASAYHTDMGSLERNAASVAEMAHGFGTDEVVLTAMYRFDYADDRAMHELAERLNTAGAALAQAGAHLSYHNHSAEFLRIKNDQTGFDILLAETDPALVGFELDTYWAACAGVDTPALMRRMAAAGRLRHWHMNDRCPQVPRRAMMTPMLDSDACELGHGCLPLDELMGIARNAGVRTIVLEQHRNWLGGSPVTSLEESARWLQCHRKECNHD